jgi:lipoprotein-anchoring transpeptidase ErfK/SrfK
MKHAKTTTRTFDFKKLWIALAIVFGVLIALYGVAAYYFSSHFGFNTSIDSVNCSFKTVAEVEQVISERVDGHRMTIKGREGLSKTLTAADVALTYKPDGQVQAILEAQDPLVWIARLFRDPREATTHASVGLDEKKLVAAIKKLDLFNEKKMRPPADAYPEFSSSRYVVHPEDPGSTLDEARTNRAIDEALRTLVPALDLDEAGCYVPPKVFANNPDLIKLVEKYNTYAPFEIVYTFGEATEVLDASVALDWIDIAEDGTGTLNEDALTAWVTDFGLRHDTIGSTRTFTTAAGEEATVVGGTYGWEVDEEAERAAIKEALVNHSGERRDPHYVQTAAAHAEPGTPDWGTTYIELDLTNQHMYYIVDGEISFEANVVTGAPWGGRATPAGVYRILEKLSPTILKGDIMPNGKREYETPVTYWMRITWGGVGFHDATWQPSFGGNRYTYAGSHGCINMSYGDARTLYGVLEVGTPVVSHY